ncbi:Ribosome biogenesis ATPase rix7 [Blastocladiella emersonii ATCC 22665]|nr:Ribosome biogenesis ATPase rix7 [Blastocladiella emersonii ATCC 22665]
MAPPFNAHAATVTAVRAIAAAEPAILDLPMSVLRDRVRNHNVRLRRAKEKLLDAAIESTLVALVTETAAARAEAGEDEEEPSEPEVDDDAMYAGRGNRLNQLVRSQYLSGEQRASMNDTTAAAAAVRKSAVIDTTPTPANGVVSTNGPVAIVGADGAPVAAPASAPTTPTATKRPAKEATGKDGKRRKTGENDDVTSGRNKRRPNQAYIPTTTLADLGGIDKIVESLLELVALPLTHPEVYQRMGVKPTRGILLNGPPGCGKTSTARALAGQFKVPFFDIAATTIVSGMSGESEKKIRDIFDEAMRAAPCILFIDEIDAITQKRESSSKDMERRIVTQLLKSMDDLSDEDLVQHPVIIMGATNRPDSLDPALRRAGRFDREITMGVPDEDGRVKILEVLGAKLRLAGDFDFRAIARITPGYVGADLTALTTEAGMIAVKRVFEMLQAQTLAAPAVAAVAEPEEAMDVDGASTAAPSDSAVAESEADASPAPPTLDEVLAGAAAVIPAASVSANDDALGTSTIAQFLRAHPTRLPDAMLENLAITLDDFHAALPKVQPSSKREGFATVPDVSWDQIGALAAVRAELRMAIVNPVAHPDLFASVGIDAPAGVLLWGPPGCGKTLLAKAVANEAHSNFISVKGPELLNKYVGESERAVRQVFARARASAPCVIFFDEIDALVPRRDDAKSEASSRVVNTLLTELDGLDSRRAVYIIAATNRPDILDPAMLRPGRLDKLLHVRLPQPAERVEILATMTRKTPLHPDVDLRAVALDNRCDGFSGADLSALVREASVDALREYLAAGGGTDGAGPDYPLLVGPRHFDNALENVAPSVSRAELRQYEKLDATFGAARARGKRAVRAAAATPADDGAAPPGGEGDDEPAIAS